MIFDKNHLSSIVFGFRFEKAFCISDISGEICDIVLHDFATPFGPTFFPRLNEFGTQDKTLVNDATQNFLKITPSDIIFKYVLGSYSNSVDTELDWLKNSAIPFVKDKILEAKKIRGFERELTGGQTST